MGYTFGSLSRKMQCGQMQFGGREREGVCVRGFGRSYSECVFFDGIRITRGLKEVSK